MEGCNVTAKARPGTLSKGVAAYPYTPANAHQSLGGRHIRAKNYKHGPQPKVQSLQQRRSKDRRRNLINVNTILPKAASKAFKAQQSRRMVWMLGSKAKGASSNKARQLMHLIIQQQKKLKKLSRDQDLRGKDGEVDENEPADPVEAIEHQRLAAWRRHVYEDQQTTRAAGYVWARECFYADKWEVSGVLVETPSREAFADIIAHFLALPPHISYRWPRARVCYVAKLFLEMYDKHHITPGSKEMVKARIRMVREMVLEGALGVEMQEGLEISQYEVSQAMLGLTENVVGGIVTHGWKLLELPQNAHFYKEKEIDWKGVKSWVSVRQDQLPLRSHLILPSQAKENVNEMSSGDEETSSGDEEMREADEEDMVVETQDSDSASDEKTSEASMERSSNMTDEEHLTNVAFPSMKLS